MLYILDKLYIDTMCTTVYNIMASILFLFVLSYYTVKKYIRHLYTLYL